jgi:hypothetical protein
MNSNQAVDVLHSFHKTHELEQSLTIAKHNAIVALKKFLKDTPVGVYELLNKNRTLRFNVYMDGNEKKLKIE